MFSACSRSSFFSQSTSSTEEAANVICHISTCLSKLITIRFTSDNLVSQRKPLRRLLVEGRITLIQSPFQNRPGSVFAEKRFRSLWFIAERTRKRLQRTMNSSRSASAMAARHRFGHDVVNFLNTFPVKYRGCSLWKATMSFEKLKRLLQE
jgi:hypothetical protein